MTKKVFGNVAIVLGLLAVIALIIIGGNSFTAMSNGAYPNGERTMTVASVQNYDDGTVKYFGDNVTVKGSIDDGVVTGDVISVSCESGQCAFNGIER